MNSIKAIISTINSIEHLSIVEFRTNSHTLKMMALELSSNVKVGAKVHLRAKSSHISLAKNLSGMISMSNQLTCKIKRIQKGELLCCVHLEFEDILLQSVITLDSCSMMQLKEGDTISALIKASELSIMEVIE